MYPKRFSAGIFRYSYAPFQQLSEKKIGIVAAGGAYGRLRRLRSNVKFGIKLSEARRTPGWRRLRWSYTGR
jgi:hypothetical protein